MKRKILNPITSMFIKYVENGLIVDYSFYSGPNRTCVYKNTIQFAKQLTKRFKK
jgi:hypothetical protein